MKVRIKWQHDQWWAYFNGYHESYLHSSDLGALIDSIRIAFPPIRAT